MKTSDEILSKINYSAIFDKIDSLRCRLRDTEKQLHLFDLDSKDESIIRIVESLRSHINIIKYVINKEIDLLNHEVNR